MDVGPQVLTDLIFFTFESCSTGRSRKEKVKVVFLQKRNNVSSKHVETSFTFEHNSAQHEKKKSENKGGLVERRRGRYPTARVPEALGVR